MPGGGGGGSTTTVQQADPWAGQQPYLENQYYNALDMLSRGQLAPAYYAGQTVADTTANTRASDAMIQNRAANGSPVIDAATRNVTDTLNGDYLDPRNNPGFQQALQDTAKAYSTGTAAQTDAAFQRGGAYGGSAYQETKDTQNRSFADSLNKVAGDLYNQERQRQLQAGTMAPGLGNQAYTDASQLAALGANQQGRQQALIDADVNRYNYNANLPYNSLRNYASLIGGNVGSNSTSTQSGGGGNGLAQGLTGALGGGLAGYAAAPAISSTLGLGLPWLAGPWGAAAGAGLGLLGGMF